MNFEEVLSAVPKDTKEKLLFHLDIFRKEAPDYGSYLFKGIEKNERSLRKKNRVV